MPSQILWHHCLSRTRSSILTLFFIFVIVQSSVSRNRKSVSSPTSANNNDNTQQQTFECSDANTHLYQVLSQSKTARSSGPDSSDGTLSTRHHPSIPQKAINGDHLKVCSQGFTCCTEEMESRLLGESKREFQKSVQDKIVGLSHTFESRTTKFDRFFRELLTNARRDLHNMFLKTYGLLYEQNSDIFAALFDNLTHYYGNGPSTPAASSVSMTNLGVGQSTSTPKVNLSRAIDSFYNTLYQRMFRILNQPYDFEPSYWQCMSRQMDRLKPFGDVPANMKLQVQKAFIAARTFVQGLAAGRDVVRRMMELSPSNECTSGLMRMLYCPHCRGLSNVKPCSNFCLNVVKGCLAYQADFDHGWNEYLDALLQLLNRLEGPFNIETVIDPIDVKISEAIMIFQDRGKEISDQIFSECGSPKMGPGRRQRRARSKRESGGDHVESKPAASPTSNANRGGRQSHSRNSNGRSRQRQQKQEQQQHRQFSDFLNGASSPPPSQHNPASVRPTTAAGTSLDRLARDLREKVQPAKGFWRHLPHTLCNDDKLASASTATNLDGGDGEQADTNCWNGLAKDKYESPVVGDGPLSQLSNPEVPVESGRSSNNGVHELITKLRAATSAMKKAFNGQEPDWRYSAAVAVVDVSAPVAHKVNVSADSKGNRNSLAITPKPSRAKIDSIGPAIRDGSGDIFDDTEKLSRPGLGAKTPQDTDDEDFTGGSGSGDDDITSPPIRIAPTSKSPITRKPKAKPASGGRSGSKTTKKPNTEPNSDSKDIIDFGDEDAFSKIQTATTPAWTSSEEGNGNTFEPVTSIPDPDDNEDSDEEYPIGWDDDKNWKEDDFDASTTTATTASTPMTMTTTEEKITSESTTSTVITTEKTVATIATPATTTPTKRPTAPPPAVAISTTRVPTVFSTKKSPVTVTVQAKKPYAPTPAKAGAAASNTKLSSYSFYFLLAFYSALTLLWKRLVG